MPDFSKLLKKTAGVAKRPTALPPATADWYPGIVKGYELVPAAENRVPPPEYETIIRIHLGLTDWPETGVDESDKQEEVEEGVFRPIDLSKRQLRRDFYDNSLHRLDDFIRSCAIDFGDRQYDEVLPEVVGQSVLVEVQQYLNQRTNEIQNQVGGLKGLEG